MELDKIKPGISRLLGNYVCCKVTKQGSESDLYGTEASYWVNIIKKVNVMDTLMHRDLNYSL